MPPEPPARCHPGYVPQHDARIKTAIGGYKGPLTTHLRPESGTGWTKSWAVLFANLRPAKILPQLIDAPLREVVEASAGWWRNLIRGFISASPRAVFCHGRLVKSVACITMAYTAGNFPHWRACV